MAWAERFGRCIHRCLGTGARWSRRCRASLGRKGEGCIRRLRYLISYLTGIVVKCRLVLLRLNKNSLGKMLVRILYLINQAQTLHHTQPASTLIPACNKILGINRRSKNLFAVLNYISRNSFEWYRCNRIHQNRYCGNIHRCLKFNRRCRHLEGT